MSTSVAPNWRAGWWLDAVAKSSIVLSIATVGPAGKYYFEITVNHLGSDNGTIAMGIASGSATLKPLYNAENTTSLPTGALAISGPFLNTARGFSPNPGIASGQTLAFAVDTATQLAWVKNITTNSSWFGSAAGDPVAETNGASFGSGAGNYKISPTVFVFGGVAGPGGASDVGPGTPAAAPTLSTAAGGTLASRTYYVRTAYAVFNNVPGFSSKESTITIPANSLLVVTSPPADPNAYAGSWITYASTTSGAETNQSGLVAVGTNWTEPTTGLTSTGASAPFVQGTVNLGGSAFAGALPNGYVAWGAAGTLNPSDNFGLELLSGNLVFNNEGMAISGSQGPVAIVRSTTSKIL